MTTFYIPTEIQIGLDTLQQLPDMVRKYGTRPLLVHGHRPVEDGLLEKVRTVLNEAGIPHENMGQILPNPKYDSVKRGAKIAKEKGCDLILSLGGGSTLQCAKGIAYALKYKGKGHLWDFWTGKDKPDGMMPVGSILTNPASGDELNNTCTLVKDGEQKTLTSPYGICSFAILDPSLSVLPAYPTMCQSFEVFAYLFMRYLDVEGFEADMDLLLMKKLLDATAQLEKNIQDLDARSELFYCGFLAHALHQKNPYNLNKLSNELAFRHSLSEGEALASLFFAWYQYIQKDNLPKLARLGSELFGISAEDPEKAASEALAKIQEQVENMGLATNILQTGLRLNDKDLEKLTDKKKNQQLLKAANQGAETKTGNTKVLDQIS